MPYLIRMGTRSIVAMTLFIPLLILLAIVIPALIVVILAIAAVVGVSSLLISGVKQLGKKKENKRKQNGVIDVEYNVK